MSASTCPSTYLLLPGQALPCNQMAGHTGPHTVDVSGRDDVAGIKVISWN